MSKEDICQLCHHDWSKHVNYDDYRALETENERLRGVISDLVYRGNDVQDCLDALVGNTNLHHDAYTEVCKVQEKWDIAVEALERSDGKETP